MINTRKLKVLTGLCGQKREMGSNKDNFVIKILGSISNWAWKGFQNNILYQTAYTL